MKDAPRPGSPPVYTNRPPAYTTEPTRRCTGAGTEAGGFGAKAAAEAVGCVSLSDMIERLGRGELAVLPSDEFPGEAFGDTVTPPAPSRYAAPHPPSQPIGTGIPPYTQSVGPRLSQSLGHVLALLRQLPRLFLTAACAVLILIPVLYIVNLSTEATGSFTPGLAGVPETGEQVAGYNVTDHFRIRPVHPVTGAKNVPHNGVDVATPEGTPVYAVGAVGDTVTVKCWWDVDGGGWVANQTTASLPNYVFQSLHLQENECRSGEFKAGEVIALTGNTGIGTGAHYDFRVKIDGRYVPPDRTFLESALTGELLAGS